MKKVYVPYARQSTGKQDTSVPYQLESIKTHPVTRQMEYLGRDYTDVWTGTTTKRPNIQKLYRFCKANIGAVDYLLVQKWDRLGRNMGETLELIQNFERIGIQVNAVEQWIDYGTGTVNLLLGVYLGQAADESEKNRQRTKDGLYELMQRGYYTAAQPPKGYDKIKDSTGHNILKPNNEASVIQELFTLYASGNYSKAYLQSLNLTDLKKSSFCRMFDNPLYMGFNRLPAYKGRPARLVRGLWPGIISEQTFEQCKIVSQTRIRTKKKGKQYRLYSVNKEKFPLKGHLFCLETGERMTASQPGNRKAAYYHTKNWKNSQRHRRNHAHEVIELALSEFDMSVKARREMQKLVRERNDTIRRQLQSRSVALKEQQTKCTAKFRKARQLLLTDAIDAKEFATMKSELEQEERRITLEIETIQADKKKIDTSFENAVTIISRISTLYKALDWRGKDRILAAVFPSGFGIKDGRVRTSELNLAISALFSVSGRYKYIEVSSEPNPNRPPVMGDTADRFRTHLHLLKALAG